MEPKVSDVAKRAAAATREGASATAKVTVDLAKKTGALIDAQSRAILEREFAQQRPHAIRSLATLRSANPDATPREVIEILGEQFRRAEKSVSPNSHRFLLESTNYVLILNEIYGTKKDESGQRQLLMYVLLAANSKTARVASQIGLVLVALAAKRFGGTTAVTAVKTFLTKHSGKVAWVAGIAKLAGIDKPGRKGATWIVITASRRVFGEPPTTWPATSKPVRKKPAAKNAPTKKTAS